MVAAILAIEHRDSVLARSCEITRGNLALLEEWVSQEPRISWVKPHSGTVGLLNYDLPMSSRDFCIGLLK